MIQKKEKNVYGIQLALSYDKFELKHSIGLKTGTNHRRTAFILGNFLGLGATQVQRAVGENKQHTASH